MVTCIIVACSFYCYSQTTSELRYQKNTQTAVKNLLQQIHVDIPNIDEKFSNEVFDELIFNKLELPLVLTHNEMLYLNKFRNKIHHQYLYAKFNFTNEITYLLQQYLPRNKLIWNSITVEDFYRIEKKSVGITYSKNSFARSKKELRDKFVRQIQHDIHNFILLKYSEDILDSDAIDINLLIEEIFEEVKKGVIDKYYHELKKYTNQKAVFTAYMSSIVKQYDRNSDYLSTSINNFKRNDFKGNFSGVGILTQHDGNYVKIAKVLEHAPAYEVGLMKGDIIKKIGETKFELCPTFDKNLDVVNKLIVGKVGTSVFFEIQRKDKIDTIEIIRENISFKNSNYHLATFEKEGKEYGYLKIPVFISDSSFQTSTWLKNELASNPNLDGLVLDIRNNRGGNLAECKKSAGLFLNKGDTIINLVGIDATKYVTSDFSPIWKKPLVLLVDNNTASSAEIFVSALSLNSKAIVIGEETYGKGTVQTFIDLSESFSDTINYGFAKITNLKLVQLDETPLCEGIEPDVLSNSFKSSNDKRKGNSFQKIRNSQKIDNWKKELSQYNSYFIEVSNLQKKYIHLQSKIDFIRNKFTKNDLTLPKVNFSTSNDNLFLLVNGSPDSWTLPEREKIRISGIEKILYQRKKYFFDTGIQVYESLFILDKLVNETLKI